MASNRVLALCALLVLTGCLQDEGASRLKIEDTVYRIGDEPGWSDPDLDESTWTPISPNLLPSQAGPYWVRGQAIVSGTPLAGRTPFLELSCFASADLYWDGRLTGQKGRVGKTRAEEEPGPLDAIFTLEPDLEQGHHKFALRLSSHHLDFDPDPPFFALYVGYHPVQGNGPSLNDIPALAAFGAALMGAAWSLLAFLLYRRQTSNLLFSLLCLGVCALLIVELWRGLLGYTYDYQLIRMRLVFIFSIWVAALLPWYLAEQLELGLP